MKVCGYNSLFQLGEQSNNKNPNGSPIISPFCTSHLQISEVLSFSSYWDNSIWVLENGQAYGVGSNCFGQISVLIPKKTLLKETSILIRDKEGIPCKFISAVCGENYTVYHVHSNTTSKATNLVYTYRYRTPLFLNINGRIPKSLYGGKETAAVIDTEGSVLIITKTILSSPKNSIEPTFLPENEKAVKVACLDDTILALGDSGRLFEYTLNYPGRQFVEVKEVKGQKFVDVSGSLFHSIAVSKNGEVFVRGMNDCGQLGLPKSIRMVKKFTILETLKKEKIVSAACGCSHSLFVRKDGRVLSCGKNYYGELMLDSGPSKENVYKPTETSIIGKNPFCIAGCCTSFVITDCEVPKNSPNKKITDECMCDGDDAAKNVEEEDEDENKTLTEIFDVSINESFNENKNDFENDDRKIVASNISDINKTSNDCDKDVDSKIIPCNIDDENDERKITTCNISDINDDRKNEANPISDINNDRKNKVSCINDVHNDKRNLKNTKIGNANNNNASKNISNVNNKKLINNNKTATNAFKRPFVSTTAASRNSNKSQLNNTNNKSPSKTNKNEYTANYSMKNNATKNGFYQNRSHKKCIKGIIKPFSDRNSDSVTKSTQVEEKNKNGYGEIIEDKIEDIRINANCTNDEINSTKNDDDANKNDDNEVNENKNGYGENIEDVQKNSNCSNDEINLANDNINNKSDENNNNNDEEEDFSQTDDEQHKLKEDLENAKKAINSLQFKERENAILRLELALTKKKIAILQQKEQEYASLNGDNDK